MGFSRCGKHIVVNCGDRIIRYIDIKTRGRYKVSKQYQDAVERRNWSVACFSSNGEYICAASAKPGNVTIYIWQRCYERSLEKVLICRSSSDTFVVDMVWHPISPILISITQCGNIQIWNQNWRETGENWSTFDSNFKVLTENTWFIPNSDDNKDEFKNDESLSIDIFKEDGNLSDFFSADEDENDLLNKSDCSLKNELIHLPICIKSKYSSNEICKYLDNIKKYTNEYMMEIQSKSIKISNKNEKVLHNLTRNAAPKKKRKKKQKVLPQKRNLNDSNEQNSKKQKKSK